ncbi:MAG: UbiA family prenyltransferase, partial [Candidatus Zixiibacteriota bacterium]
GIFVACRMVKKDAKMHPAQKVSPVESDKRSVAISSWTFFISYIITMRPYLFFVSGAAGITGLALSGLNSLPAGILFSIIFLLSYGFGQALTDSMQVDTDSISSPYRPLVQGKVSRRDVALVSLAGLSISGIAFISASRINILLCIMAIAGLATYTYFKRRWWGGPFYNAWIVAALCLIGYVSGNGIAEVPNIITPALISTILTVLFGYANFVLVGYYKDISADRATGYMTMPVVFGFKISAIVSDIFAAAEVAAAGLTLFFIYTNITSTIVILPASGLYFAGILVAITGQIRLHRLESEADAYRSIAPTVHSFILLLSSITIMLRPTWTPAILLLYATFILILRFRPMKEQI